MRACPSNLSLLLLPTLLLCLWPGVMEACLGYLEEVFFPVGSMKLSPNTKKIQLQVKRYLAPRYPKIFSVTTIMKNSKFGLGGITI
jgi:hypothetical protein